MSQENVEIARAALAAWNAGNWDAMRELYDPSVIWRPPEDWPEGGRSDEELYPAACGRLRVSTPS